MQETGKIVKKLEETGSITDVVRPAHHGIICDAGIFPSFRESVTK